MNPIEHLRELQDEESNPYAHIGLSPVEYGMAVDALQANDLGILQELILRSDKYINTLNKTFQTTKYQFYDEESEEYKAERKLLHQHIIERNTENILSQDHPVLLFLAGPQGVGKSFYKNYMVDTTKYVQTDPDSLRQELLPDYNGKDLQTISRQAKNP